MTPDEACRATAAAVIRQAYADIEHGGELADATVREVQNGGLDIFLALDEDVSAEVFLEAAREARIKKLEKRISGRDKS